MEKYVLFLRGINVGGNSKVPMQDLKKLLEDLGFENVKTILNSGNVVFETSSEEGEGIKEKIEGALEKKFGFRIIVILRTIKEIEKLVNSDPFKEEELTSEKRFYVTFLPKGEVFNVVDLSSQGTTDLMKNLDKEYGKENTTRNWNTVKRILTL